ncbi:C2H2 finger domain protein [Zopfia rhizophila CBS 207.26]|uniref:C2H2 finger domain protein n=1 Tax=Zopfia rhizophila CBS 207.26 TaxID=1314779 RepID=A0A6A6DSK8_9PEZI|nr:C2H2 finger domain protein [Zopfia rhizophila CBS 207.26]
MRRRDRSSSSSTASDDDSQYETDLTSVDDDTDEGDDVSDTEMTDEECLTGKHARPPEYYRTHAEEVNKSEVVQIDYAPKTRKHMDRLKEQWWQHCTFLGRDPIQTFKSITTGDLSSFFRWKLDQTQGKDGRRLRGTKEESSLATYWKHFLQVYNKVMKRNMDGKVTRQMHKVLRQLAREYRLGNSPRDKCPMDVYDVTTVLQTTLTMTEKMFKIGRSRIQTIAFFQGGFITANRPEALLNLQYKHIVVTLLRHPMGGPHRVLLEWTYEFTKTFLGPKAPNTFPIPEILYDPSLILSPHAFYLGLMFADKVFSIPELTPENIYDLDIRPGCNSLPVPQNPEKADMYVFRRCVSTPTGYTVSNDLLPDYTVRSDLKKAGEISGFKQVVMPYRTRYGSGAAFNKDGTISDALQNMIMKHADMGTFLNHYLPRRITADTQAIVRGMAPQDEIMQAACRMSRWLDPDRPWRLTTEQSSSVNMDPQIQKLLRQQAKLKDKVSRQEKYKQLGKDIRNARQRLRRALRDRIRENWDREQAERDIQLQLSGVKFSDQVKTTLKRSPERTPQHNRLIESVLSLPGSSLEEEARRRSAAINAIIAYCHVVEGETPRVQHKRSSTSHVPSVGSQQAADPLEKALEAAKVSVYSEKRPTVCWVCLGNERAPIGQRIQSFCTPGDLSKHFKKIHLARVKEGHRFGCDLCKVALDNEMHWRRHGIDVHGTVS